MVGTVSQLQVGELMIEHLLLDIVECVIAVNSIGGPMISMSSGGPHARSNAGDISGGEVGF